MRLLVINPFGDTEFYGRENLERIARPDTEFDIVNIADMYPLRNNQWLYFRYMCTDGTLEKVLWAEKNGYDAIFISCNLDIGLYVASIETSARAHRIIYGTSGWIAYTGLTNDGGVDNLKTHNVPPKGGKAEIRLSRIGEILHGNWGKNTLEDLKRMQRDHGHGDLCAHGGSTLTAFICDLKSSKMRTGLLRKHSG